MNWAELQVVAAEAPDPGGIMISAPIVRASDGTLRRVRDVTDEHPRLSQAIAHEEFAQGIRQGFWIAVPERTARRHYVTTTLGPALARGLERTGALDGLDSVELTHGWQFVYSEASIVDKWRSSAATTHINWSADALAKFLTTGMPDPELIDGTAHLAISLTQEGSPQRLEIYVLLGAISNQTNRPAQAVLQDLVHEEFEWTAQQFDAALEARLRELSQRSVGSGDLGRRDPARPTIYDLSTLQASFWPLDDLEQEERLVGAA
jgi:hypothetical protein